ncbi:hypothetical protein G9A89_020401 [Geosiphon pyriformis]|nr:hypothetical protein G9A89_020401 [Geosiphon pyriformis]
MAAKVKNSKKQQQAVTTAMVIPNSFVIPNKILDKIFTAAASSLSDMNNNNSSTSFKMGQNQPLAMLFDIVLSSRSLPIPEAQQFIISNNLKDWTDQIEIESTAPPPNFCSVQFLVSVAAWFLNSATKVAIGNNVFLTTLKIARSSGMISVSSSSFSVVLHNIPLNIFFNNIKSVLGIFGVVTSVKLKPAGLWQYAVIYFKNTFFAAAALTHWSVLVRKDNYKKSFLLLFKLSFNTSGGPKVFKLLFAKSKFYAKAAAFMVPSVDTTANMNLDFGGSPKTTTSMLPIVFSAPNIAVKSKLTSLESHLSKLSVLIKFLVKFIGALVVLVTKLLSTSSAMDVSVKKSVAELVKKNKDLAAVVIIMQKKMTHLEKKYEWTYLKDVSDEDKNMDNNDNDNKDFLVYNNIFDIIMHL